MSRNWFGSKPPVLSINPGRQIDQELAGRSHRIGIGILIDENYSRATCTLIVTEGRGKFMRIRHSIVETHEIAADLKKSCVEIVASERPTLDELLAVQSDLSQCLWDPIESLKQNAGKYVDRIMYVSVSDKGIRTPDFDGHERYTSLINPVILSNLSGLAVVDSFQTSDMSAGGSGWNLNALPIWMLLADRSSKIANIFRVYISISKQTNGLFLPPSDGLDSELPNIRHFQAYGEDFIFQLAQRLEFAPDSIDFSRLNKEGHCLPRLMSDWERTHEPPENQTAIITPRSEHQLTEELIERAMAFDTGSIDKCDLIRTAIVFVAKQIAKRLGSSCPIRRVTEFIVQCDSILQKPLHDQLEKELPIAASLDCSIQASDSTKIADGNIDGAAIAFLGMMHIDQMPANIPWITGATSQRMIGRLTPGSPANWRHLIRNMAEFQPPAMRLRDAI